ncbi:MAG: hypothetical protein U0894_04915 [Pirellulales bacterium]
MSLALLVLGGCQKNPPTASTPAAGTTSANPSGTGAKSPAEEPIVLNPYKEREGKDVYPSADLKLEAPALFAEVEADRKEASNKYDGKIVEVNGQVKGYFSYKDSVSVSIEVGHETKSLNVSLKQDRPWLKYPPGSTVTVRGKVGGFGTAMYYAQIVDGQPVVLEPTDLAKVASQYQADADALGKEASSKAFRLKGKVVSAKPKNDSQLVVLLGDAAAPVELQIENYEMTFASSWKAGDEVECLGTYNQFYSSDRPTYTEVLVVSPLPEYPQWPEKVTRTTEFSQGDYLPFTADLLGEWVMQAPRVLEWQVVDGGTSELEVVATVDSVATEEGAISEDRIAWLKNSAGAKIGVTLDGSAATAIAAGDKILVRGSTERSPGRIVFGRPTIEKR